MKKTSIITATVASVTLMAASAALAAPVVTMTGATADQTLTWPGCKTLKTTDTVTVTFDDSGSYSIVDSGSIPYCKAHGSKSQAKRLLALTPFI